MVRGWLDCLLGRQLGPDPTDQSAKEARRATTEELTRMKIESKTREASSKREIAKDLRRAGLTTKAAELERHAFNIDKQIAMLRGDDYISVAARVFGEG